jgi:hypothetical protein
MGWRSGLNVCQWDFFVEAMLDKNDETPLEETVAVTPAYLLRVALSFLKIC